MDKDLFIIHNLDKGLMEALKNLLEKLKIISNLEEPIIRLKITPKKYQYKKLGNIIVIVVGKIIKTINIKQHKLRLISNLKL